MYLIGTVLTGPFGFAYFGLLNTAVPGLTFVAMVLSFVPHDLTCGPQVALIAAGQWQLDRLPALVDDLRRAGAVDRHRTAAIGSGYMIALYILFCAVVSIVAAALIPDYTNKDISEEHDRP
jgi:hypothetical protein